MTKQEWQRYVDIVSGRPCDRCEKLPQCQKRQLPCWKYELWVKEVAR